MGVPEFKYKLIAFATSSFFAGVAGALFASHIGKLPATQFSLALSVEFIAILLIGGVGTVSGTMMGTFFVVLMPEIVKDFTDWLCRQDRRRVASVGTDRRDRAHRRARRRLRARLGRHPGARVRRSTCSTGTSCCTAC